MEFRVPQPVKTLTGLALVAYGSLTFQQLYNYEFTIPLKPAFTADIAHTGGTAITKGERGHHPRPPDGPVETHVRRYFGGAAIPDS